MNAVNISTLSLPASPVRSAPSRLVRKLFTPVSYSLPSAAGGTARATSPTSAMIVST